MYGFGCGGNNGGPAQSKPDPSVRLSGDSVVSPRSDEAKAAKRFLDTLNSLTFNSAVFGISLVNLGGKALRPRIMQAVESIVEAMAGQYDVGDVDNDTVKAKRILEAMQVYR